MRASGAAIALLAACIVSCVCAERALQGSDHHIYAANEVVPIYANKIGPFANPTETYHYFDLPFCHPPDGKAYQWEGLGEVLEGDRLVSTAFDMRFATDQASVTLCSRNLTSEELDAFRSAIKSDYYYQMFLDDLPLWGFVGKVEGAEGAQRAYLFTHTHFDLLHTAEGEVIQVDVSADASKTMDLGPVAGPHPAPPLAVSFSYSAAWKVTDVPYARRMDKYARYSFLPQHLEIHWFSIINSCVTVLLLTGFLAAILLRVLRRDLLRYARREEGGLPGAEDEDDDQGWKNVHGDVFRPPPAPAALAAAVGGGAQMLSMGLLLIGFALLGHYYPYNRGALLTSCVALYALSSFVAGFVGARVYGAATGRDDWSRPVALCMVAFALPLTAVFGVLNTVAIFYRSTAALPFGTIVILCLIWACIAVPLAFGGGLLAYRRGAGGWEAPCRTSKLPRPVPGMPWFRGTLPQMLVAGFLPFSAIYIELHYIFASVWGHKVYLVYPVLAVVFVILCTVTAFITIALTYFQLAVEDHRWWWRSFFCGGSTALFFYAYALYYYHLRSDMSGLLQASFYFGYMGIVAWTLFLLLGSIGWAAAGTFVRHIYRAVKLE